jgi:hypothetical protein
MSRVDLRFFLDPATGEPHIYQHGVSEDEVEEVLRSPGEDRPGRGSSWVAIGATEAGRILRVIWFCESGWLLSSERPRLDGIGKSLFKPSDLFIPQGKPDFVG